MFRLGDVGHWCRLGAGPDGLRKERRELLHLGRNEGAGLTQVTDMAAEGYCQVPDALRWLRAAPAPGRLGPAPALLVRPVAAHETVPARRGPQVGRRESTIAANVTAGGTGGGRRRRRVTRGDSFHRSGAVKTEGRTGSECLAPGRGLSGRAPRPA